MKVREEINMMKRWPAFRTFFRDILPLLIPVLIEQYFVSVISGVSTIMVSRLGSEEISAIGSVGAFLNMLAAIFVSLSVGGTILAAQYLGRGQRQRLNQVAGLGIGISFILAVLVSLVIFIFRQPLINNLFGGGDPQVLAFSIDYFSIALFYYVPFAINTMAFGVLRGAGDVQTPMKISIIINLINMAASYLFIYGIDFTILGQNIGWAGFGVRGSAIALLISQFAGAIIVMIVLLRGSRAIRLNITTDFYFEKKIISGIFRIGLPAGIEQLILNFGFLIIQTFIVTLPTAEIAAHSIVNSVAFLINAPALAIATITSTLIGRSMGEGDTAKARQQLSFLQTMVIIAFALSWIIFIPGSRFFVEMYSQDSEAIRTAIPLVIGYLLSVTLTWAAAYQVPNGLRAAGDANFPSLISIICIIIRVIMTYLLIMVFKMNITAVWIIAYFDISLRALLYTFRRRGERWLQYALLD